MNRVRLHTHFTQVVNRNSFYL